jgi:microcystin degradation protein MlrC
MTQAIRMAVLTFVHETVTFLPNDTTFDDFVAAQEATRCSPGRRGRTWAAS